MDALRLADQLFLIGHDEYSGKAAVNGEILATGLAGAVLGELLLDRRISCAYGKVLLIDPRQWMEAVTDAAVAELQARRGSYVVRAWVEHLRPNVREQVGQRLVAMGLVRREIRGTLARRAQPRFPGVDATVSSQPRIKLAYQLERPGRIDAPTALLAALVLAAGLEHLLVVTMSRQDVREQLSQISASLPAELQALTAGVQAAVTAIALTVRR